MPECLITRRTLLAVAGLGLSVGWNSAAASPAEPIRIGGTGSALALLQRLAEHFKRVEPASTIEIVPSLGSKGGIAAAHSGTITLAVSVRELNEEERAFGLVSLPFLETPLLFATGTSQPMALRSADVIKIYSGEMVRWPDGTLIRLILRPRADAQAMMLVDKIPDMPAAMKLARARRELPVAANDHDNIDAARTMSGSFTAFPLIQLMTERNELKPVRLDGVEPTLKAMRDGSYAYKARYMLLHRPDQQPALARFLAFLATDEARSMIEQAGGSPLSAAKTGA